MSISHTTFGSAATRNRTEMGTSFWKTFSSGPTDLELLAPIWMNIHERRKTREAPDVM